MNQTNTLPEWLPDPVKSCIREGQHLVEFDESTGECHACGCADSAEWDFTIDEQGPIDGSELPAESNGWSRRDVWHQDPGSDDAIGLGYAAGYVNGNRALDLTYFVTGHHQSYDVQLQAHGFEVNDEGEHVESADESYEYSHPFDFGFTEYEAALWAARNGAMRDERFKL